MSGCQWHCHLSSTNLVRRDFDLLFCLSALLWHEQMAGKVISSPHRAQTRIRLLESIPPSVPHTVLDDGQRIVLLPVHSLAGEESLHHHDHER